MYRSTSDRSPGSTAESEPAAACERIVSLALCKALLIAAGDVPRTVATSATAHPMTSTNSSATRWRGGSRCTAATKASLTLSRAS